MSWGVSGNKGRSSSKEFRPFRGNENIGLFMLSLGSWKTPTGYVTGSQRNKAGDVERRE